MLFHSLLQKSLHDSDPERNIQPLQLLCRWQPLDFLVVVVVGVQRESEITYISGTCSYLGVFSAQQSPSLSARIWSGRNPGGIDLSVGNYGNDCVLWSCGRPCQIWTPAPPIPSAFFTLPKWRHFRTKYSQNAAALFQMQQDSVQGRNLPTSELLFKRNALSNSVKTCGMQLWSGEEYICRER